MVIALAGLALGAVGTMAIVYEMWKYTQVGDQFNLQGIGWILLIGFLLLITISIIMMIK